MSEIDEIRISHSDTLSGEWNFKLTFSDGSMETGTVDCDGNCWEAVNELIHVKALDLRHDDFAFDGDFGIWTNPAVIELDAIRDALAGMRDDPEVCHSAEEIQRQMPITEGELDGSFSYGFDELVRLAAHDLYRAQHL